MKAMAVRVGQAGDHVQFTALGRRQTDIEVPPDEAIAAAEQMIRVAEAIKEGKLAEPVVEIPAKPLPTHDARGYKLPEQCIPGYNIGIPPRSKGKRYPPTPPTAADVYGLLQAVPKTRAGRRNEAMYSLLYRSAMRISEALALVDTDLDFRAGSIEIQRGKGGKRRTVGMDDWGWEQLAAWLDERRELPPGPIFCVVKGPTAGLRPVGSSDVRTDLKRAAKKAGITKRVAPHQFRHAWTVEAMREGIPLPIISRQLGHSNLAVTTQYVQSITNEEVIDYVRGRSAPTVAVPDLMRLLSKGDGAKAKNLIPIPGGRPMEVAA